MASSYPQAIDNSFPGFPYADNVEFVMANMANSWVSAFIAIETTIGAGQGSSVQNPLFSPTYNQTYATLTARIAALEATLAANQITLDGATSDIQPVGATAQAGSSGEASDAKHVHVGVTSLNSRSGALTTRLADVVPPYTAAGQMVVGTGNAAGELLSKGTTGQALQVGGADPSGLQWTASGLVVSGMAIFTTAVSWTADWLLGDGKAVSRASFASLMTATTLVSSGTSSNGSRNVIGLTALTVSRMWPGMAIEGPGIAFPTTIASASGTTVVLSQNAGPSAGAGTFTVFPHGNGDGSTTFNVADMRGRSPIGCDWDRDGPNNNFQPWGFLGGFGGECNHALALGEGPFHQHGGGSGSENNTHSHSGNTSGDAGLHGHTPPFGHFICDKPTLGRYIVPFNGSLVGGGLVCDIGSIPGFGGDIDCGSPDQSHTHGYNTGTQGTNHQHSVSTDNGGCIGTAHNNLHPYYTGIWLIHV